MGLMVGMVIVYQILFVNVASHVREYATLKAIGFTNQYLRSVVMSEAVILALLGFLPGVLVSAILYRFVAQATFLPLELTDVRCVTVFGLIVGMCGIAGILALRKLRDADPVANL